MKVKDNSEKQVGELVENWAKAVRDRNMEAVLSHHDDNIVMYDVPEPFQSKGIEAYKKTWDLFYSWARDTGVFDILELNVVAGQDVAFCYATMRCAGVNKWEQKEILNFRLTIGLKKINQQWIILHEHHSVPAT
jgi:ketosteroid isomerase-like protein